MPLSYKLTALEGKIIAIDGPAGSGKSTTARLLASKLNFVYLDTGAMYRAVTLLALENSLPLDDGKILSKLASGVKIRFIMDGENNRIFVNKTEVTEDIRTPEVTEYVSQVSAHAGVRMAMVTRQKEIGKKGGVVAEGRDTTSVVFPDADFKIFLDASLETRAQRRMLELIRKGVSTNLEEQRKDLARRDKLDSTRNISPLKKTRDSIIVDTTNLTIEEQVDRIIQLIRTQLRTI